MFLPGNATSIVHAFFIFRSILMTAPPSRRVRRRQFAVLGSGTIAAGLGSLSAMSGCRVRSAKTDQASRYRISGPSMNPTLWGPSRSIDCQSCDVKIRVDDSVLQLAMERLTAGTLSSSLVCWHCGAPLASGQLSAAMGASELPPDVLDVVPSATSDLDGGDILLIRNDAAHVKRLLGKPGQTISIDQAGRLLVDDRRPTFSTMPHVAVDWDRLRDSSRWFGSGEATRWQRQSDRRWTARGHTDWLVYGHENIYHGERPGRILDDYPGNMGVQRSLFPADGLSIEFELVPSRSHGRAEIDVCIAFWTEHGIDLQRQTVMVRDDSFVEATARRTLPDRVARSEGLGPAALPADSLSPQRPLAMRISTVNGKLVHVRHLSVSREVLYRINPTTLRSDSTNKPPPKYPLQLGDDEWFVVGDNVPLSIDSRSWGAVTTQQIVGRVDAVS